jgi:hypothetical protein
VAFFSTFAVLRSHVAGTAAQNPSGMARSGQGVR